MCCDCHNYCPECEHCMELDRKAQEEYDKLSPEEKKIRRDAMKKAMRNIGEFMEKAVEDFLLNQFKKK